MDRKTVIERLVKKNLASGCAKGCVPCLGMAARADNKKGAGVKK